MRRREERILEGKTLLHWGISLAAEIPEFLLHMRKKSHSLCWRWLDLLQYGIRLFELWDFSHSSAGNISETTSPSLFPLAALILLCHCSLSSSAIYCCKPVLFARSTSALMANLAGKADSAVLWKKKDLMRERVQADLPSTLLLCKCFHNHQSWKLKVRSKRRIRKGERKLVWFIARFVDYGYW